MKNHIKNKPREAPQSIKSIQVIIMFMLFSVLFIGTVSAFEFDNFKYYDELEREYTIVNAFGRGEEITKVKLTSDLNQLVPRGYQKVAEFKVENYNDYVNVFNGMEFFNLKKDSESFTRSFDYKYKTIIQVPTYKTVCDKGLNENGTFTDINCRAEQIGLKDKVVWNDINKVDGLLKGNITIGIFTNVEKGDKVEWIPTLFGERLTEWAGWQESWNVDLLVYFKEDEQDTSGTGVIIDSTGNKNATNVGASNITGKILTAYNFTVSESDYINVSDMDEYVASNAITISAWINPQSWSSSPDPSIVAQQATSSTRAFTLNREAAGGGRMRFVVWNSAGTAFIAGANNFTEGKWNHMVGVVNGTHVNLYLNGTLEDSAAFSGTIRNETQNITIGRDLQGGNFFNGGIDEVFIASRAWSASEISDLYDAQKDGFVNGSYTDVFGLIITLNFPVDAFNTTNQTILFNGTVTKQNLGIANVSLFIDGILNETNSSGINDTDYLFTKVIVDGNHNWTYESCDTGGDCTTATTRTFNIDTNPPIINITFPTETISYHLINTNLSVNWTVFDANLDTCILEYEGTNTTVNCLDNQTTINITTIINRTIIFYANDTLGDSSFVTRSWNYTIFEYSQTFNEVVLEGSTQTFSANITVGTSNTISIVSLVYNGTANTGSSSLSGNNTILTIDFTVPTVNVNTNITFFWSLLFSSGEVLNLTSNNQTITVINIDDCSSNTFVLYNYTVVDEELQTLLSDTTTELNINIFDITRENTIVNFSKLYTNVNPFAICLNINLNSTSYSADSIVKYEADNYAIEYYNIVSTILTNTSIPINITLYDLNLSDSTEFVITFKGENFLPIENALIFIERQYIAENNSFKTVELPKTDSNGQTLGHFVRNDIIYNLRVIKDNEILGLFNNIIAFCQDFTIGDCRIDLGATPQGDTDFNYDAIIGIIFQTLPTYNNITNTISFSFSTNDGTPKTIFMEVTRNDIFGNRTLCNNSITSASGTLACSINPNIDDTVLNTKIYVNNQLAVLSNVKLEASDYGSIGYVFWFFLTFVFIFIFGSSKTQLLIGIFISFAGATALGITRGDLIGLGSAGIWVLVIVILGIWKINKENPQ